METTEIKSPFTLWKYAKYVQSLPDDDLKRICRLGDGLRPTILHENQSFCLEHIWLTGGILAAGLFLHNVAKAEWERRKDPTNSNLEVAFCHYEPFLGESSEGYDEIEAARHSELAKLRASGQIVL